MTVEALISDLESRGVSLEERDGRLILRPATAVTPDEAARLKSLKGDVLKYLRTRAAGPDVLRLNLWKLDRILELSVPYMDVPLIIAPGCRIARELRGRGSSPGRIWCVCEVLDLLLSNIPPSDARKIAETRFLLGATTASVEARQ